MRGLRTVVVVAACAGWACLGSIGVDDQPDIAPIVDGGNAADAAVLTPDAASSSKDGSADGTADPPINLSCKPLDNGATMPTSIGGKRLRAVAWTSPDGLDIAAGIHDAVANLDCPTSVGRLRLPT